MEFEQDANIFNRPVGVVWFTGATGCVGIVKVMTDTGDKYYIGVATGLDEKADAQSIADWGAQYPRNAGRILFQETA